MHGIKRLIWILSLIALDLVVLFLIFEIAWFFRAEVLPRSFPWIFIIQEPIFVRDYYWIIAVWPVLFFYEGLYNGPFVLWEEARRLAGANTIAAVLIFLFIGLTRAHAISRSIILLMWGFGIFLFPLCRYYFKIFIFRFSYFKRKMLLYGAGLTGKAVLECISRHPELGMNIVGVIDDDPQKVGMELGIYQGKRVSVIALAEDFLSHFEVRCVDEITISISNISRERLMEIVEKCSEVVDRIDFVPDAFGTAMQNVSIKSIDTALIMRFEQNLARLYSRLVKRVCDILLSSFFIILFSPLWLVIFIAIKIDSRGKAIFLQGRIGKHGKKFLLYKYRSMYTNSDHLLNDLLNESLQAKDEWDRYRKLRQDPRVTRVGFFIRRCSIDELPQLFNVLKGDMSLVGPRPYLPDEMEAMGGFKEVVFKAKPGITGLWQVSGRNHLTFDDRVKMDVFYVKNWSLWLDIIIFLKTTRALFSREGAF